MRQFTSMKRRGVRNGWLHNSHINIPVEVWRPLLKGAAENQVRITASFEQCGSGAIHDGTGHLTGVTRAFVKLNITKADVDTRALRVWGEIDDPTVHIEPAPNTARICWESSTDVFTSSDEEVYFADSRSKRVYAYRGLQTWDHAPGDLLWLDGDLIDEELPQVPSTLVTEKLDASHADRLRLAFIAAARGDEISLAEDAVGGSDDRGVDEVDAAREGDSHVRVHHTRERDQRLRDAKLRDYSTRHPALSCEVCGFEFVVTYGRRGKGFAEVHHLAPLGKTRDVRLTTLDDLAVVCANCHRMLHRDPFCSLEQLRSEMLVAG